MANSTTVNSKPFSDSISSVCKLFDNALKDYEWNREEVHKLELLTQDYLHQLELEPLHYRERAKVATKLQECRRRRRKCKDVVELLDPLVQLLESDQGRSMHNQLKKVLGETRKIEKRMQNRTYCARIQQEAKHNKQ